MKRTSSTTCIGRDRLSAGVNEDGRPIAWMHRIVGPAILARYLPPAFKNGMDLDGVDGAAQLLYDIPAMRVEFVRHEEPVLNTGFWRGVGGHPQHAFPRKRALVTFFRASA